MSHSVGFFSAPSEGPAVVLMAARRGPLEHLAAHVPQILDFVYMPALRLPVQLEAPKGFGFMPMGQHPMCEAFQAYLKEYMDAYALTIQKAIGILPLLGTGALPAQLVFMAEGDAFGTTRILTFDRYFKIEDRCHSSLGHEWSSGIDFWCTAQHRCDKGATSCLEARVWLVVECDGYCQPQGYFKTAAPLRSFELLWTPESEMKLVNFDAHSVIKHTVGIRGCSLWSSCLKQTGPLSFAHVTDEHESFSKLSLWLDGPQAFPMFGCKNAGPHYFETSETIVQEEKVASNVIETLVIETLVHEEPAARISAKEAAQVADEQLATWTQHNAGACVALEAHRSPCAEQTFDSILLLRFTRHPNEFERCLHEGPELEPVRASLKEADLSPRLACGASIFVYPEEYAAAKRAIAKESLRPFHIVVSQAFFPLVREAVSSLASRLDVRLRSAQTIAYTSGHSSDDFVVVEKTFLGIPRMLREPGSVVQSTAEAHGAPNPRRSEA